MNHELSRTHNHTRWNQNLPPCLRIQSGDVVRMEMHDSSGGQVHPGMGVEAFLQIDRERIHTLTGPIQVEGAEPGDALVVEVLDLQHEGWAWTSFIPGLGLLKEHFHQPFLQLWELDGDQTRSLPGVTLDLHPFCGIMGVCPAMDGDQRTRPPGHFGGNMDVRHLTRGSVLRLPVQVPGALFSAGDAHAAQGDGEVCINGMEAPMVLTARFTLEKGKAPPAPEASVNGTLVSPRYQKGRWQVFIESDQDFRKACERCVLRAIDHITARSTLSRDQAYVLCSVVLDIKVSQVVNEPVLTLAAYLPETIFE